MHQIPMLGYSPGLTIIIGNVNTQNIGFHIVYPSTDTPMHKKLDLPSYFSEDKEVNGTYANTKALTSHRQKHTDAYSRPQVQPGSRRGGSIREWVAVAGAAAGGQVAGWGWGSRGLRLGQQRVESRGLMAVEALVRGQQRGHQRGNSCLRARAEGMRGGQRGAVGWEGIGLTDRVDCEIILR